MKKLILPILSGIVVIVLFLPMLLESGVFRIPVLGALSFIGLVGYFVWVSVRRKSE